MLVPKGGGGKRDSDIDPFIYQNDIVNLDFSVDDRRCLLPHEVSHPWLILWMRLPTTALVLVDTARKLSGSKSPSGMCFAVNPN